MTQPGQSDWPPVRSVAILRARLSAARLIARVGVPVTITIRSGTYYIDRPLKLGRASVRARRVLVRPRGGFMGPFFR